MELKENIEISAQNRPTSDQLVVDITINSDEQPDINLLVQGCPHGYQFDAQWEEPQRASNNCIYFEDLDSDYAYENTHPRDADIEINENTVVITDPEPRGQTVGYDPATLRITYTEEGFNITLEWVDEKKLTRKTVSGVPFIDPRDDREEFYEWIEAVQSEQ